MTRLQRLLLNALTVLTLLFCIVTVALWIRSFWVKDEIEAGGVGRLWAWSSNAGSLTMFTVTDANPWGFRWETGIPSGSQRESGLVEQRRVVHWLGITLSHGDVPDDDTGAQYAFIFAEMPHGVLTALCAAVPAGRLVLGARRRRRTPRANNCPTCGYDLRATPDRCPECGTAAAGRGQ
jgi:hypothetical protein